MLRFRKMLSISFACLIIIGIAIPFAPLHRVPDTKVGEAESIPDQIFQHIKNENDDMEDGMARTISRVLYEESRRYGVDYRLILALMKIESSFQHDAVSPRGARGLLQVKPSLARFIARDLGIQWDGSRTLDKPDTNIKIGVHVLSRLMIDFQSTHLALKAYNIGPTKMKEISQSKVTPTKGFPGLVMNEYRRNVTLLPDP
jgi:soluble lytic murein transglycosylase